MVYKGRSNGPSSRGGDRDRGNGRGGGRGRGGSRGGRGGSRGGRGGLRGGRGGFNRSFGGRDDKRGGRENSSRGRGGRGSDEGYRGGAERSKYNDAKGSKDYSPQRRAPKESERDNKRNGYRDDNKRRSSKSDTRSGQSSIENGNSSRGRRTSDDRRKGYGSDRDRSPSSRSHKASRTTRRRDDSSRREKDTLKRGYSDSSIREGDRDKEPSNKLRRVESHNRSDESHSRGRNGMVSSSSKGSKGKENKDKQHVSRFPDSAISAIRKKITMMQNEKEPTVTQPAGGLCWAKNKGEDRDMVEHIKNVLIAAMEGNAEANPKLALLINTQVKLLSKNNAFESNFDSSFFTMLRSIGKNPATALAMATGALDALSASLTFTRDGSESTIAEAFEKFTTTTFEYQFVDGNGNGSGKVIDERHLGQLRKLLAEGQIEADVLDSIACLKMNINRKWLDATWFVVFESLRCEELLFAFMECGLNVVFLANSDHDYQQIISDVKKSSGKLLLPVRSNGQGEQECGVDVVKQTPELRTFLLGAVPESRMVICNATHNSDGQKDLLTTVAVDLIVDYVLTQRPYTSLAGFINADFAYPIPLAPVEAAAQRADSEEKVFASSTLSELFGPFKKNAPKEVICEVDGFKKPMYFFNGLRQSKGLNYMTSNLVMLLRHMVCRYNNASLSSLNVVPMDAEDGSDDAIILAGMEKSFTPCRIIDRNVQYKTIVLMMLNDLINPESNANPEAYLAGPMEVLTSPGFHGGLWRCAYQLDTIEKAAFYIGRGDN